jgi:hypothetical protein
MIPSMLATCIVLLCVLYFFGSVQEERLEEGDYVVYQDVYYGYVVEDNGEWMTFKPKGSTIAWQVKRSDVRRI